MKTPDEILILLLLLLLSAILVFLLALLFYGMFQTLQIREIEAQGRNEGVIAAKKLANIEVYINGNY